MTIGPKGKQAAAGAAEVMRLCGAVFDILASPSRAAEPTLLDIVRWHANATGWVLLEPDGADERAERRGHPWLISDEHAIALMAMACSYCGGPGGGIDRSDNDVGYTTVNAVPCCGACNLMKRKHTVVGWIAHMRKVIAHMEAKR